MAIFVSMFEIRLLNTDELWIHHFTPEANELSKELKEVGKSCKKNGTTILLYYMYLELLLFVRLASFGYTSISWILFGLVSVGLQK